MKRLTRPNIDDVFFYRFHPEILVDFSADYHQETVEIIVLIINKLTSIYKQLANDDIYVDDEGHFIKNHDDDKYNIYLCHFYLLAYQ